MSTSKFKIIAEEPSQPLSSTLVVKILPKQKK